MHCMHVIWTGHMQLALGTHDLRLVQGTEQSGKPIAALPRPTVTLQQNWYCFTCASAHPKSAHGADWKGLGSYALQSASGLQGTLEGGLFPAALGFHAQEAWGQLGTPI